MADFVNLTCPNCAGRLQITPDVERFACMYCGTELIVKRGGGIVLLNIVTPGLATVQPEVERPASEPANVQSDIDRTASALAIQRLEPEIAALAQQINGLNEQLQQGLANLASEYSANEAPLSPVSAQAPFYVRWLMGRALWKSLLGGVAVLTLIACLILFAVALADPGKSSTTSGQTGVEAEKQLSSAGTFILCTGCLAYPLSLLFLFYAAYATRSYNRKSEDRTANAAQAQAQQRTAERDTRRAELLNEIQAQRAPLEAEIDKRKQQLAEHRRIVGG